MSLLSLLSKIGGLIADEITTPAAFKAGQDFEDYVRQYIFTPVYYDLLQLTHDYHTNSRQYVESSLLPDFMFRDRYTKREFYVEAKFRTEMYKGKFVWCNNQQLQRYQLINQQVPVFLILGDGGKADWPDNLSLIPMNKLRYTGLYPYFTDQFAIEPECPVTSSTLWQR